MGHPQVIGVAEAAEFHGAGHVGDDFRTLPRAQPHAGDLAGPVEQAGVGGDHLEFPAVVKSEVMKAHVGAVKQAEAGPGFGGGKFRVSDAVDMGYRPLETKVGVEGFV